MRKIFLLSAILFCINIAFAQTDDIVHKSGDETITGIKTFNSILNANGGISSDGNVVAKNGALLVSNSNGGVSASSFASIEVNTDIRNANRGAIYIIPGQSSDRIYFGTAGKTLFALNFQYVGQIENMPVFNTGGLTLGTSAGSSHSIGRVGTDVYYNSSGPNGGNHRFFTKEQTYAGYGTSTERMRLSAAGNLLIGTKVDDGYSKLAVNGRIRAKEIKVETANFPDYVFQKDYFLLPLNDLEKFIKLNNHLPEIPSAKEVEENGVNLGEMNAKLLEKIEELTLHLIEQNKKLELQQQQIDVLLKKVGSAEK
ncbi:hypothetical protein [Rubrolithibacter danxiaensis]|uniref:hypothetical protein n=1 Tax=Rubrolithibacter danxiaensis TaxID=3390805 RepID=UPI003BF7C682